MALFAHINFLADVGKREEMQPTCGVSRVTPLPQYSYMRTGLYTFCMHLFKTARQRLAGTVCRCIFDGAGLVIPALLWTLHSPPGLYACCLHAYVSLQMAPLPDNSLSLIRYTPFMYTPDFSFTARFQIEVSLSYG
jgi:hypothetical protein